MTLAGMYYIHEFVENSHERRDTDPTADEKDVLAIYGDTVSLPCGPSTLTNLSAPFSTSDES